MSNERERALEAARRIAYARPIEREAVYLHEALTVARALLASSPPPSVLPCDVMVAPATIIRKGCTAETLALAISRREGQPTELVTWDAHPGRPSPPPSCEMRKALEHIREYWNGTRTDAAMWDALNHIVETASAALDASRQEQKMKFSEAQIKHMVSRFLSWKLPENFRPDAGISFKATFNEHTAHPMKHEPFGTNLFDATQADAMVRYMLADMPLASRTEDAWQPISTAPKDGTRIIIAWGGVTTTGKYLDNSKAPHMPWAGWVPVSGDPWPAGKPTHWQPLPAPPSRTEEKAADTCEHDWSEWEPVLGGRGFHVERKCSKCGKKEYDD